MKFAFDWPELWKEFEAADDRANSRKSRSRAYGFVAIAMVLAALLLASWELSRAEVNPEIAGAPPVPEADSQTAGVDLATALEIELIAAGLGLLGTALGLSGVLHRSTKRKWLRDRLVTETLRQFHFQRIVRHFPEIVAAANDRAKKDAYVQARTRELTDLMASLENDKLDEMIESIADGDLEPLTLPAPSIASSDTAPLAIAADAIDAYRASRLGYQLEYTERKVDEQKSASFFPPQRQEKIFSRVGWSCIILVVAFHAMHLGAHWVHFRTDWLNLAVIWVALIALAIRALEDGLQPQREVERYEQYKVNCRVSLKGYNAATTLSQLIDVMRAFESMSVEELRLFIRVHDQSRFVL